MKTIQTWLHVLIGSSLSLAVFLPAHAQDTWTWPDSTENLQVLPSNWPGSRLRPVMTGFTEALGVRCSYCHVGEEGMSLSTYDFVSDDNPNKGRAREMLRLLGSVNGHLRNIEPSGDKRVNMWCHTCHRGRPRPMTLEEELGETYRLRGLEAALGQYSILKEEFFGRGAYNFGENALNAFGYELMAADETAGAIRVFTMNSQQFPESGNVWDSLAEAYLKSGDQERAREYYKKSLALNPLNDNARQILLDLEN